MTRTDNFAKPRTTRVPAEIPQPVPSPAPAESGPTIDLTGNKPTPAAPLPADKPQARNQQPVKQRSKSPAKSPSKVRNDRTELKVRLTAAQKDKLSQIRDAQSLPSLGQAAVHVLGAAHEQLASSVASAGPAGGRFQVEATRRELPRNEARVIVSLWLSDRQAKELASFADEVNASYSLIVAEALGFYPPPD